MVFNEVYLVYGFIAYHGEFDDAFETIQCELEEKYGCNNINTIICCREDGKAMVIVGETLLTFNRLCHKCRECGENWVCNNCINYMTVETKLGPVVEKDIDLYHYYENPLIDDALLTKLATWMDTKTVIDKMRKMKDQANCDFYLVLNDCLSCT